MGYEYSTAKSQKADKGGGIVVIDYRKYLNKIDVMLSDINNYTPLPEIHLKLVELDIGPITFMLWH